MSEKEYNTEYRIDIALVLFKHVCVLVSLSRRSTFSCHCLTIDTDNLNIYILEEQSSVLCFVMEPPPLDQTFCVRVGDKDYPYAVNDTTTAGSISELIRIRLGLQNGALVKLSGVGLADDTRLQAGTTYVFADSSPRGNHKIPIVILCLICNKTPIIE